MNIIGDPKVISAAFVKARGEMSATVKEDGAGIYGKYATLAAIVKVTAPVLAKHGLAIIQETQLSDGGVTVDTWLIHESGSTMQFAPLTMPLEKRTPQAVGSATTYARRYQLASVCGLASDDDDDGQAAEDSAKPVRNVQATKPAATQKAAQSTQKAVAPSHSDDVLFDTAVPTDAELEILGKWATPDDAFAWAVENKACKALEHAKNSLKAIITKEFDGKFNTGNAAAVYLALLRHWLEKTEQAKPEAVAA